MTSTLRIARAQATAEHLNAVLGLIEDAGHWLRDKGTDQWAEPWPDQAQRDARVRRAGELGATWIVWDKTRAVATVTVTGKPNPAVWSPLTHALSARAVYAHRLIVARKYAGWGLGAELMDWTGLRAHRNYGARWIRIDVWSTNVALHDYYMKRGFEPCGYCRDPCYPSGALYQKPVSKIAIPVAPLFSEAEPRLGRPEGAHLLLSPADSLPFRPDESRASASQISSTSSEVQTTTP